MSYEDLVKATPAPVLGIHMRWLIAQITAAVASARLAEREAKAHSAARRNQVAAYRRALRSADATILLCEPLQVSASPIYALKEQLLERLAQEPKNEWPAKRKQAAQAASALRAARSHARADSPVPARKACLNTYREALRACGPQLEAAAFADLQAR